MSRVRSVLGVEMPVRTLFEASTVAELAPYLSGDELVHPALVSQDCSSRLPLSPAQFRLWFLHTLEGPSATYNIPLALRLEGELNLEALAQALRDVVSRHESLRTVFGEADGEPYQQVVPVDEARVELLVETIAESSLAERLSQASLLAMDLEGALPVSGVGVRAVLTVPCDVDLNASHRLGWLVAGPAVSGLVLGLRSAA